MVHMAPDWKYAGTVSNGTLNPDDLLPAFLSALYDLDKERRREWEEDNLDFMVVFNLVRTDSRHYFEVNGDYYESLSILVNEVQDILDELAPPPYYFGNTEGDGADFGFWQREYERDSGDYITSDYRKWYQYGQLVLDLAEDDNPDAALRKHMADNEYWPDLWFESDHGNQSLMVLDEAAA